MSASETPRRPHATLLPLDGPLTMELVDTVERHHNWPKPGVTFLDILPLFRKPQLLQRLFARLAEGLKDAQMDAIAALDARGFLFLPLATLLNVPFIPVRKAGKLPGATTKQEYELEYGTAAVEVQVSGIEALQKSVGPERKPRVLLVDDLMATGGTLTAAAECVEAAGGQVIGAFVFATLADLDGVAKFNRPVYTAMYA